MQKDLNNEHFDVLILNISVVVLFSAISINNYALWSTSSFIFGFVIFAIIMFIAIRKSLVLYYKHKLLVHDLEETKHDLTNSKKEIERLEAENLNFSKTSHSIAHRQKALEYKLNKLLANAEFSKELSIKDELNAISKSCFENKTTAPLAKTTIEKVDDMLLFMQSECIKNNIDFELALNGNIHYMINNFISNNELEILLADLIKNSIIAINNSDNVNRSILVKLGLFDGNYGISVYDSGIEFKIETLLSLGIQPCSTHLDAGGTGMGFMNTFDTVRKHQASIFIQEFGKPNKDNYTKVITVKFDKGNIFKILSYRSEEIIKTNYNENLIIEKTV